MTPNIDPVIDEHDVILIGRALRAMGVGHIRPPLTGTPLAAGLRSVVLEIATERDVQPLDQRSPRKVLADVIDELDDAIEVQRVIDKSIDDHVILRDDARRILPEYVVALAEAVNAKALAIDAAKRFGVQFVDPGIGLREDVVEMLRDAAVAHALAVIGLVAEGTPTFDEPLARARARVAMQRAAGDPDLACRMAGVDALTRAGGGGKMPALLNDIPGWLAAFSMVNFDRLLLEVDLRDANVLLSAESGLEALHAWPRLPESACTLRGA